MIRNRKTEAQTRIATLRAAGRIPADCPAWATPGQWARFSRHAAGVPMKQIALDEGVTPEAVRQIVDKICRRLVWRS